jgi:4-hydroxy-tetrahydrodipicolinate synthase
MPQFTGVIPILATPFHDDESLDHASLTRTIEFFASTGVNAVTLLGVLGESNRLTDIERSALIATAVKAARDLPVTVGCSHTGTSATIELAQEAANLGATAIMIAPSRQPVPNDEAVFTYYAKIAEKSKLPIVLQDHPASTEVHMSVALVLRMARELPSISCIKAEAVPSPPKIAALRKGLESIRPIPILTGLGALYGFFDIERGSDGFNTGFAFPEILLAIVNRAKSGDLDGAYALYQRFLPLMVFEQQPGLAIRKEILRRRGLLASGRVRHPGGNIDTATTTQLAALLNRGFPEQDIAKALVF